LLVRLELHVMILRRADGQARQASQLFVQLDDRICRRRRRWKNSCRRGRNWRQRDLSSS
jgi:hypothetical protein